MNDSYLRNYRDSICYSQKSLININLSFSKLYITGNELDLKMAQSNWNTYERVIYLNTIGTLLPNMKVFYKQNYFIRPVQIFDNARSLSNEMGSNILVQLRCFDVLSNLKSKPQSR